MSSRRSGSPTRPRISTADDDHDDIDMAIETKPHGGDRHGHPDHKLASSSRVMRNLAEKVRRDKLNHYVAELATIVPLVSSASKRIDKTSVLRLAANYIRMHNVLQPDEDDPEPAIPDPISSSVSQLLLQAIGGFLLVVTSSGKVVFVTETVEKYFGHTQVDLMGHSVYNVIHPDDHNIVTKQLNSKGTERHSFFCRMMEKALSRNDPGRYEIIHIVGQVKPLPKKITTKVIPCDETSLSEHYESDFSNSEDDEPKAVKTAERIGTHMLVSFVRVVHDRPITELSLMESIQDEYITRHGMDGKILYTDHRISFVTGLMPGEVCGQSAFNYMHQDDLLWSIVAQQQMFNSSQGQGLVSYRLRCRDGKYITLRTRGYMEVNKQTGQVDTFVCINTVLSIGEASEEIKSQRRKLLPIIKNEEAEDMLSSISSAFPPEIVGMLKHIITAETLKNMVSSVEKSEEFNNLVEVSSIIREDSGSIINMESDEVNESDNVTCSIGNIMNKIAPSISEGSPDSKMILEENQDKSDKIRQLHYKDVGRETYASTRSQRHSLSRKRELEDNFKVPSKKFSINTLSSPLDEQSSFTSNVSVPTSKVHRLLPHGIKENSPNILNSKNPDQEYKSSNSWGSENIYYCSRFSNTHVDEVPRVPQIPSCSCKGCSSPVITSCFSGLSVPSNYSQMDTGHSQYPSQQWHPQNTEDGKSLQFEQQKHYNVQQYQPMFASQQSDYQMFSQPQSSGYHEQIKIQTHPFVRPQSERQDSSSLRLTDQSLQLTSREHYSFNNQETSWPVTRKENTSSCYVTSGTTFKDDCIQAGGTHSNFPPQSIVCSIGNDSQDTCLTSRPTCQSRKHDQHFNNQPNLCNQATEMTS